MPSDHLQIQVLANTLKEKGVKHVVFSPGSRNAPLVIQFSEDPDFECLVIPDERSAAFFALGMAQYLRKPVAICCTSGTATLNYAPAIAEAYYQQVPLIVLTADRPKEWIDQGEGQSMRQENVYHNYIRYSCELPVIKETDTDLWYTRRLVTEAAERSLKPGHGPVHINIPLREPLYGQIEENNPTHQKTFNLHFGNAALPESAINHLAQIWNKSTSKIILVGQVPPNPTLNQQLNQLAQNADTVVIAEHTGNISGGKVIYQLDPLLTSIEDQFECFRPEILVTLGTAIISKKIKQLIRKYPPDHHWHIDPLDQPKDTFACLTEGIAMDPTPFFEQLTTRITNSNSAYNSKWDQVQQQVREITHSYAKSAPFSDFKACQVTLDFIPEGANIHLGNSAIVRYVQLFSPNPSNHYFSNRGVSGIDGCTSTAVGYNYLSDQLNIVFTGELSFLYDSNALWNQYLNGRLRIIVFNNQGGGIFRFINGPSKTSGFEQFFDTDQPANIAHLAKAFNVEYYSASNASELKAQLPVFFQTDHGKPQLLEIFTPKRENDLVWKAYFQQLKANNHDFTGMANG